MAIELTEAEKKLLQEIMADKFSNGAFCGMTRNHEIQIIEGAISRSEVLTDADRAEIRDGCIKYALATRVRAKELTK
jgi:hypothetical protein